MDPLSGCIFSGRRVINASTLWFSMPVMVSAAIMALMMDSSTACTVVAKIASIVVRRHFGQWLFPVFGVWVRGGDPGQARRGGTLQKRLRLAGRPL
jgi:hypothetical protein